MASLNRSWQAGDRAPLLRMATIGSSIAALSVGATKVDNPIANYAGEWGAKHIPILDPITGVLNTPHRAVGNMLTAPITMATFPFIYGIRKFYDVAGVENKGVNYLEQKAWSVMNGTPYMRYFNMAKDMVDKK
jgi:hypothetical protein